MNSNNSIKKIRLGIIMILGIQNACEFFCETLSLYYTNPSELKDWNEEVYRYIENMI